MILISLLVATSTVIAQARQNRQKNTQIDKRTVEKKMSLSVAELRCEYRRDPAGIDVVRPRLSWILNSAKRGERQTAYQVLVASSPERLTAHQGDLWDSGRVASDSTIQVEYAGKALASRQRCYWSVRTWGVDGKASDWSAPAFWSMGLLAPSDWHASWIGYDAAYEVPTTDPAHEDELKYHIQGLKWVRYPMKQTRPGATTLLRTGFTLPVDRKVTRAVAALYADNVCIASVNGQEIGQAVRWDRTARLSAASALRPGPNSFALKVTENDLLPPCVIGRLVISFDTGADMVVPVDGSWKTLQPASGQKIESGWDRPEFDPTSDSAVAGGWRSAEAFDGTPWRGPAPVADVARVPVPYLRKAFTIAQPVKKATAYVTALGAYELRINGQKVGKDVLTPGWTEYRKRVLYQTYDVTGLLHPGGNALGAMLGDGWYASVLAHLGKRNHYGGRPRLLAQLVLEMADGTTQTIGTDASWKASYGPLLHADLLIGCEYDARQVLTGWDRPGYDASRWASVVTTKAPDGLQVQAAVAEPSRVLEELPAKRLTQPAPGCWTFDLGQNMVGWARIKVHGTAGQRITVRHGEMLNPDCTLYTANLRSCPATDFYILSGKGDAKGDAAGVETLEPAFTFHGFRYVEIRGLAPGTKPTLEMVTGRVVHSDMERTGTFTCSSHLLNRLYENIIWGQKGNYLEVPTDCPQRDERMGWTGDTQFFVPTAAYNYDVAPFFTRWLTICEDDQNPDGTFPHVVPDIMGGGGSTAWGDAALLCAYQIYLTYGDTRLIATHFPAMERYMRWLGTKTNEKGISNVGGFGDWLNLGGGADGKAIDTAYHVYLCRIMAEMARAIGRTDAAESYTRLHDACKAAFQRTYLQPDGSLTGCSQTGYALAFTMGLLPDDPATVKLASEKYVEEIHRFHDHLATGFIGTPRLLPGLNAAGRNDIAYKLLLTETYPSWLYQVTLGATTMWERWNAWTPDGGFGDVSMNSFNHYAFGAVGEYLYDAVGGIRPGSPGYKSIVIRPVIESGLTWAKTTFRSPHGPIATSWKRTGNKITLEVTIPTNTTATIYLPTIDATPVTESGKPLPLHATGPSGIEGIHSVRMEKETAIITASAGTYLFASTVGTK